MTFRSDADEHPWMFQRDEIDVMEDELEELYRTHDHRSTDTSTMEHSVMKEQLDAEERVEAELVVRFGAQMLEHNHADHTHEEDLYDSSLGIREHLRDQAQRDPLYTQAYAWAEEVFQFAKTQYTSGEDTSREMFRVYLNARLIPIKLSIGQLTPEVGGHHDEAMAEDAFTSEVIKKEFELALLYLDRTLESLQVLISKGYQLLIPFSSSGLHLRGKLLLALKRFL